MNYKIALLSEHASPLAAIGGIDAGGQNIAVAELALHLAKQGHQVDVFTRWDDATLPQLVNWQPGIRVVHVQAGPVAPMAKEEMLPYMPEFAQHMILFFTQQAQPYDLVHAHFFMSGCVACQIKQTLQIPFVVTFHALGEVRKRHQGTADQFPAERTAIEQQVIQQADAIVALCPQDYDDLVELYGANPDRIKIIPNGFNPSQFYPIDKVLARLLIGFDTTEPLLLQLGRLVPRKGVDNVIKALGCLHREYGIHARLLIVGGDSDTPDLALTPEIGRLTQIAREEGVADWVTFTGSRKRDDLRYFYSAADVFITTPWYEPFGITPLESMACGTPVVGASVGGIKHTIVPGKTGFLVPPNKPAALAAKLATLIYTPKLCSLLSKQAIQHVQAEYTWQRIAELTANLYQQVLIGEPIVHYSLPFSSEAPRTSVVELWPTHTLQSKLAGL